MSVLAFLLASPLGSIVTRGVITAGLSTSGFGPTGGVERTLPRTWIVDASGRGDFLTIQDAIDAALDGDLIQVRDTGLYDDFHLTKGVMVQAERVHFQMGPFAGDAFISDIGPGLRAGISGLRTTRDAEVRVDFCQGEVILEDLRLYRENRPHFGVVHPTALTVKDSANVSVDGLVVEDNGEPVGVSYDLPNPAVVLIRSRVRISDSWIEGQDGAEGLPDPFSYYGWIGRKGGRGLACFESDVVIARTDIHGGDGGFGGGDPVFGTSISGDGGVGLLSISSELLILGREEHVIRGGDSGPTDDGCRYNLPGDGGTGLELVDGPATVSRVQLIGGECGGGTGRCSCNDGAPFLGTVERTPRLVNLEVTTQLDLGDRYLVEVDGQDAGVALLVISNAGGWRVMPGFLGPRLSALPQQTFRLVPLGRTDATGDLVWTGKLSSDASALGQSWVFQVAVFGHAGTNFLSNAVTRVVGQ